MKVSYHCDEQRGAGYGYLLCSEEAFAAKDYDLCLQRAVDKCYLSPQCEQAQERWMESRSVFTVAGSLTAQGELVLPLEPRAVNVLSTQDTYRLSLAMGQNEKPLLAQFRIEQIVYSSEDSLNNAQVLAEPEPAAQPLAPAILEPVPETLPEPSQPVQSQSSGGKKNILWFVCALLLLALAAFLLWFFLWRKPPVVTENVQPENVKQEAVTAAPQKEEKQPEPQSEPIPPSEPKPEPQPAPEPPAPEPAPEPAAEIKPVPSPESSPVTPPPVVLSVEEQVRAFFAGSERTAARAVTLAQELAHTSPAEQDAVFRLYYFAAEQGENRILLDYAACFDPAMPAWGSIHKDAIEANRLYEKAKTSLPEAEERQKQLKQWLEQASAGGDAQAKAWLLQLSK